jgi:acetamidase/formamidase
MSVTYHLDDSRPHAFWDRELAPRVTVDPGDVVEFDTLEGTGQVTPQTTDEALAGLDPSLIHALTGPVAVAGAAAGDRLIVHVESLRHRGWGWNGVIPGFGLLGDEFAEPHIHHYELHGDECRFADGIVIPYDPFCGVMGVAPGEAGRLDTGPPRANAGNLDIRNLTPGSVLELPVLVPGARFSCGDCHSAQGDGEVNGTGIETPMTVRLRFELEAGPAAGDPGVRFRVPAGRPLSRVGDRGWFATTGIGPDLFAAAQSALRRMLDHLVAERGLTRPEAYCLAGAAVDLKISEIVNAPHWIVSAYLPEGIFTG